MIFVRKIFPIFSLLSSILLLIYIIYKSQIYWEGNLVNNYYKNYYIILVILILLSIFVLFMNDNLKVYFIIFILSVVLSLYLFESYLSFNMSNNKVTKKKLELFEEKYKKKYDTRSKIEVYKQLSKTNSNTAVTVYPFENINSKNNIFPFSGLSNSKTIYCNENGYYSMYESDRYGFNNPDKEWDQDEIEYLLLGDSFTHGACVNRPHDIGSALRTISNKPVLNLGYAGNGPLIEYATLREYFRSNIKNVIFLYFEENDLFNLHYELSDDLLKNYLTNPSFSQNLMFKQNLIDQIAKKKINENFDNKSEINKNKKLLKLLKFLKLRNVRNFFKGTSTPKPMPQPEFKKILKLTKDLVTKNNSKLYFVYLPVINKSQTNSLDASYYKIKEIVRSLDITFIDMYDEIFNKEENQTKYIPFMSDRGVHYNILGYNKVAETIYNYEN